MTRKRTHQAPDLSANISAYSEADKLFESGRFRKALQLFQTALQADPSDGDALHAIGSCYDALHKPAHAASAYRSALILLPEERHPELHFNIGNALLDLGLYADAMAEYALVPANSAVRPAASKNSKLASAKISDGG